MLGLLQLFAYSYIFRTISCFPQDFTDQLVPVPSPYLQPPPLTKTARKLNSLFQVAYQEQQPKIQSENNVKNFRRSHPEDKAKNFNFPSNLPNWLWSPNREKNNVLKFNNFRQPENPSLYYKQDSSTYIFNPCNACNRFPWIPIVNLASHITAFRDSVFRSSNSNNNLPAFESNPPNSPLTTTENYDLHNNMFLFNNMIPPSVSEFDPSVPDHTIPGPYYYDDDDISQFISDPLADSTNNTSVSASVPAPVPAPALASVQSNQPLQLAHNSNYIISSMYDILQNMQYYHGEDNKDTNKIYCKNNYCSPEEPMKNYDIKNSINVSENSGIEVYKSPPLTQYLFSVEYPMEIVQTPIFDVPIHNNNFYSAPVYQNNSTGPSHSLSAAEFLEQDSDYSNHNYLNQSFSSQANNINNYENIFFDNPKNSDEKNVTKFPAMQQKRNVSEIDASHHHHSHSSKIHVLPSDLANIIESNYSVENISLFNNLLLDVENVPIIDQDISNNIYDHIIHNSTERTISITPFVKKNNVTSISLQTTNSKNYENKLINNFDNNQPFEIQIPATPKKKKQIQVIVPYIIDREKNWNSKPFLKLKNHTSDNDILKNNNNLSSIKIPPPSNWKSIFSLSDMLKTDSKLHKGTKSDSYKINNNYLNGNASYKTEIFQPFTTSTTTAIFETFKPLITTNTSITTTVKPEIFKSIPTYKVEVFQPRTTTTIKPSFSKIFETANRKKYDFNELIRFQKAIDNWTVEGFFNHKHKPNLVNSVGNSQITSSSIPSTEESDKKNHPHYSEMVVTTTTTTDRTVFKMDYNFPTPSQIFMVPSAMPSTTTEGTLKSNLIARLDIVENHNARKDTTIIMNDTNYNRNGNKSIMRNASSRQISNQKFWEKLPVSVSPLTKERVYIVTPVPLSYFEYVNENRQTILP